MRAHINGWFRPTPTPTRLVVRSERYELPVHFHPAEKSCRCQAAGCELCGVLGEPELRYVHVVEHGGALRLLEIASHVHAEPLQVGDVILVSRRQLADFAQTFLEPVEQISATRVWPANYLAALGQKQYERAVLAPRSRDLQM